MTLEFLNVSFCCVHPLCDQAEDGNGAHEEHCVVESSSRDLPLLIVTSGLDEESSEVGKIGHVDSV